MRAARVPVRGHALTGRLRAAVVLFAFAGLSALWGSVVICARLSLVDVSESSSLVACKALGPLLRRLHLLLFFLQWVFGPTFDWGQAVVNQVGCVRRSEDTRGGRATGSDPFPANAARLSVLREGCRMLQKLLLVEIDVHFRCFT